MKRERFTPKPDVGDFEAFWPAAVEAAQMLKPDDPAHEERVAAVIFVAICQCQHRLWHPRRPSADQFALALDLMQAGIAKLSEGLDILRAAHLSASTLPEDQFRDLAYPWAVDLMAEAFGGPKPNWRPDSVAVNHHWAYLERLRKGVAAMQQTAMDARSMTLNRPPDPMVDKLVSDLARVYTDVTRKKPSAFAESQPFVRFVRFVFQSTFDEGPTAKMIAGALRRCPPANTP
jgi:hypothetical protein